MTDHGLNATITHTTSVGELLTATPRPDLVILDLLLGDASTPTRNIASLREAGFAVLVITSGERPELVREAAHAGVLGVICKTEPDDVIARAINTALRGEPVESADWAAAIDTDQQFAPTPSPRERDVLARWASGETAAGVAELLEISVHTVNMYLRRIKEKCEAAGQPARTKSELRAAAHRAGLAPRPWWRRKA
ncbi:LuxR C-terminal-related transcriptional regulator [Nocardia sp. NPDC059239]|uniref:response regulator transcription factor n=1 Tax=Nocardia sp. NPDC059239 TaxID=3346785 RepID=UPI0036815E2F